MIWWKDSLCLKRMRLLIKEIGIEELAHPRESSLPGCAVRVEPAAIAALLTALDERSINYFTTLDGCDIIVQIAGELS